MPRVAQDVFEDGKEVKAGPSTPSAKQRRAEREKSEDWEDQVDELLLPDDVSDKSGSRRGVRSPLTKRVVNRSKRSGRSSPISSPRAKWTSSTPRQRRNQQELKPSPASPAHTTLKTALGVLFEALIASIRLTHALLTPIYPYLFLSFAALLLLSGAIYALLNVIPPFLFSIPGHVLHLLIPSWSTAARLSDIALGQNLALIPLRSLATPACALTGQLCTLSFLSSSSSTRGSVARPFWEWASRDEVDIGGVARSLVKEAKGAKDIFESISLLSEGGLMDRLEYVRIWELGAAIQVGSTLDTKDIVSSELYDLGNLAKELSDELVETNAMAIDAFTWLQWEVLSLPPAARPDAQVLSSRLNSLLNRLSNTLGQLHKMASSAHALAQRGSNKGQNLRSNLNTIGAELRREHEREPGWRHAVDKANRFFVGGDPSKAELIARDLRLTELTITSLSGLVRNLEETRSGIKGFRDQIGFFDASMMGFHLGAGGHVGIGPEDEVRILNDVVEEFGKAVGRAKRGEEDPVRKIES